MTDRFFCVQFWTLFHEDHHLVVYIHSIDIHSNSKVIHSNKKGYHCILLQQVINQTLTTAGKQQQQQPAQQQVQLAVPATQAQALQLAAAQGTHAQTVQLAAPTVTIGATGQLQVRVHLHWAKGNTKSTRKHSSRMHTACLETVRASVSVATTNIAWGVGGILKWTSLNKSPVITIRCH